MHTRKYLILLFLLPSAVNAQVSELTGLWKGMLFNDTTRQYYRYEIAITSNKGKLTGYSHTWFLLGDKRFYGLKKIKVKQARDGKIIIEDNGLLENNYPVAPAKNVRQLNVLTLSDDGEKIMLEGPFSTNRTKEWFSLTGSVSLIKMGDYQQSDLMAQLEELGIEKSLNFPRKEFSASIIAPKIHPGLALDMPVATADVNLQEKKSEVTKERQDKEEQVAVRPVAEKIVEQKETPVATKQKVVKVEQEVPDVVSTSKKANSTIENRKTDIVKTATEKKETSKKTIDPVQKNIPEANNTSKVPTTASNEEKKATVHAPEVQQTSINALNSVVVKNAALKVAERNNELQQTVPFSSDSLQLSLFDNGEVDGDTVSVLMNENLIIANQRLSTTAFRKTIYINPGDDSVRLIMYAENLGAIAPNTGLLVIRDGKDIYEVRFRGDLQKNAEVILRRKK